MTVADGPDTLTEDAFLGDRLTILQPRQGYRAGVDAVLLAAAAPVAAGRAQSLVDCGAGAGTVGLCVAVRCPDARVTLVEREPDLIEIATRNIDTNGLASRCQVVAGDVTANALLPSAPRLEPDSIDHALANPPYHATGGGTPPPDRLKSASHTMPADALDLWLRFMTRIVKPGGSATMIHKADQLDRVLAAFGGRFGGLRVLPIHAYPDEPAIRVIVQGTKGSRAGILLLPGLILHNPDRSFRALPKAIFRDGAALDLRDWPNSAADAP